MNKNHAAFGIALILTGYVSIIICRALHVRAMRELVAKSEADRKRIWQAARIVERKIKLGCYEKNDIDTIMNDFEFYKQVMDV